MGFLDRLLGGSDDEDPARATDIARVAPAESRSPPSSASASWRAAAPRSPRASRWPISRSTTARACPICQVMGSSVYKVGWQNYPWGSDWGDDASLIELRPLTDAWNHARSLALGRLAEEARIAGCHAVVDVTFANTRHEFLAGEIEIAVNGTAVHLPEAATRRS